jgi:hypothetical protein
MSSAFKCESKALGLAAFVDLLPRLPERTSTFQAMGRPGPPGVSACANAQSRGSLAAAGGHTMSKKIGRQRRPLVYGGLLAATLALGACGTHPHAAHKGSLGPHGSINQAQRQLLYQDANRNGIRDQDERALSIKDCKADPCELVVTASGQAKEVPGVGFDCGVGLDFDAVMLGRAVTQIGWKLQAPVGTGVVYRFAPIASGARDPYGVYLYAEAGRERFAPSQPKPDYFVQTPRARKNDGFAYGVYLQWKPRTAPDSAYQACIGLDPVIFEHD